MLNPTRLDKSTCHNRFNMGFFVCVMRNWVSADAELRGNGLDDSPRHGPDYPMVMQAKRHQ